MYSENIMVSIVMLIYNHESYLKQALESVLMQNVDFKYEIIVGEDCSKDNSRSILKEYEKKFPDKFNIIYRDTNIGATKNGYDLLTRCTGKYIACLEGDDYWTDPDKLKIQVDFLEKNNDFSGVSHIVSIVDERGSFQDTLPSKELLKNKNLFQLDNVENLINIVNKSMDHAIHIQSCVFRNLFLDNKDCISIFKLLTTTKFVDDIQIELLILEQGKIKLLDSNMGCYRKVKREGNDSFNSQNNMIMNNDIVLAWVLIDEYFNYKYSNLVDNILMNIRLPIIVNRITNNDLKSAIAIFIKDFDFIGKIKVFIYIFKRAKLKIIANFKVAKI